MGYQEEQVEGTKIQRGGFRRQEEEQERVLLAAVGRDARKMEESLRELQELAETAGALAVGKVIQLRDAVHPGAYMGSGKIREVRELLEETGATGIICDDELSPAQLRNLELSLETKVMDRTLLILDIFAQRAVTSEGKLQVELAQLRYRLTRLVGLGKSLSRLGGGIGTRGPGEKKLEMDRRLIRERIAVLNRRLTEVVQNRDTMRKQRSREQIPVVAIVGYTNAGKSTLLNVLTGAQVLEENKLFATLDPTTRILTMENGQRFLFTDTVGFINKLPHPLIRAFQSTLEEAKYADIILHVADASNPKLDLQRDVVYETLHKLGVENKKIVTAFNKMDCLRESDCQRLRDDRSDAVVHISAKYGRGITELLQTLEEIANEGLVKIERVFPYEEAGKISRIRELGRLEEEEYREDGIFIRASVPPFLV